MRNNVSKRLFIFVLVFSLVVMAAEGVMADEPSRVVVVPFKINADRDLSFLKDGILDMLTSRLSWEDKVVVVAREETNEAIRGVSMPLNEETARGIGAKLQAGYVLFGSLTMFGNSVSLDGKMVDVRQKEPTLTFFKQTSTVDEVIPQINLFAGEIQEKIFGRPVAAPRQVAQAPGQPDIYAHPEKLVGQITGDQATVPGMSGFYELRSPAEIMGPAGIWRSQTFKIAIKGMALGDVDGDDKTEVVFVDDRHIQVYRFENKRLLKITEMAGNRDQKFLGVDVADINGNGRAEIFVTSLKGASGETLGSFVLESDNGDLKKISEDDPWYYRVIDMPDMGKVLVGQRRRMGDLFVPGVYRMAWIDGQYTPQERLALPEDINVFGFALGDVMNDGKQMIAAFDKDDYIRLFSASGNEEAKSDESYGGSMNYLEFRVDQDRGGNMGRLYLPQRIFVRDVNGDGKYEVIVPSNQGALGRLLATFRNFSSGRAVVLAWSNAGLVPMWQTPKMSAHVSDLAIGDFDNDGEDEVVAVHMAKQGTVITAAKSTIVAYKLTQPEPIATQ